MGNAHMVEFHLIRRFNFYKLILYEVIKAKLVGALNLTITFAK
jgi:hypothetical protein